LTKLWLVADSMWRSRRMTGVGPLSTSRLLLLLPTPSSLLPLHPHYSLIRPPSPSPLPRFVHIACWLAAAFSPSTPAALSCSPASYRHRCLHWLCAGDKTASPISTFARLLGWASNREPYAARDM